MLKRKMGKNSAGERRTENWKVRRICQRMELLQKVLQKVLYQPEPFGREQRKLCVLGSLLFYFLDAAACSISYYTSSWISLSKVISQFRLSLIVRVVAALGFLYCYTVLA